MADLYLVWKMRTPSWRLPKILSGDQNGLKQKPGGLVYVFNGTVPKPREIPLVLRLRDQIVIFLPFIFLRTCFIDNTTRRRRIKGVPRSRWAACIVETFRKGFVLHQSIDCRYSYTENCNPYSNPTAVFFVVNCRYALLVRSDSCLSA